MAPDQLTSTQQAILYKKDDHPDWTNTEIAESVGCSESHVSETLNEFSIDDVDGVQSKSLSISWLLVGLPLKIMWWCFMIPAKMAWTLCVEFPLRLLFGPKND